MEKHIQEEYIKTVGVCVWMLPLLSPSPALIPPPLCRRCLQMLSPHSPADHAVVSNLPVSQVIWGRTVGDKHIGRAAVPRSVQRAGP